MNSSHSVIGASSAERWFNCPGSIDMIAKCDKPPESKYASEGSVAHYVAEQFLLGNIKDLPSILGDSIQLPDSEFEFEVDEEMIEAVQTYVRLIEEKIDTAKGPLSVEEKFNLKHIHPEAYGSCDALITGENSLVVIDFKYGRGYAVDGFNNKQLRYYALGAYYSLSAEDRKKIKWVETVIVQPRASHAEGPIRQDTFDIRFLFEYEKELKEAIDRVYADAVFLKAGPWCKFCSAKPMCPQIAQQSYDIAKAEFSVLEVIPESLPKPYSMKPEELALVMNNSRMIKEWAESVMAYAHKAAESGLEIPGYQLVAKRGNRAWIDEEKVKDIFEFDYGNEIYGEPKLKSPAQMEKLLRKEDRKIVDSFCEKPDRGKVLVPISTDREPKKAQIYDDFAGLA